MNTQSFPEMKGHDSGDGPPFQIFWVFAGQDWIETGLSPLFAYLQKALLSRSDQQKLLPLWSVQRKSDHVIPARAHRIKILREILI